ncbi:MAG: hypothetical protein BWZ04_00564 [Firmicutes bacterium ADurb.BinA205]|nr:MAG: hypothetical protein BWZ04_00564 [Firmicutes bacterium ADurb.BinA205]
MVEQDTIKLLRECDAGIKMGISSIDEVLEYVSDRQLKDILIDSKGENEKLQNDLVKVLADYGDDGKEPNPVAKGMSWLKTNVKLKADGSDSMIAELMIDGCNMGIKSLCRYMNQYQAADRRSKDIAMRLVRAEDKLTDDMRRFL